MKKIKTLKDAKPPARSEVGHKSAMDLAIMFHEQVINYHQYILKHLKQQLCDEEEVSAKNPGMVSNEKVKEKAVESATTKSHEEE